MDIKIFGGSRFHVHQPDPVDIKAFGPVSVHKRSPLGKGVVKLIPGPTC